MADLFESNWSATKDALLEGLTGNRKSSLRDFWRAGGGCGAHQGGIWSAFWSPWEGWCEP